MIKYVYINDRNVKKIEENLKKGLIIQYFCYIMN